VAATADVVVVGAGLAGLTCADRLLRAGLDVHVLEAAHVVEGRVHTDRVDGFLVDRGFRVPNTAYPEARRVLDLPGLDGEPVDRWLRPFFAGVALDGELTTSSRFVALMMRMFARGRAVVPAQGMRQIPRQLTDRPPADRLHLATEVRAVSAGRVETDEPPTTHPTLLLDSDDSPVANIQGALVSGRRGAPGRPWVAGGRARLTGAARAGTRRTSSATCGPSRPAWSPDSWTDRACHPSRPPVRTAPWRTGARRARCSPWRPAVTP
jgi:hypothetical protein